MSRPRTERTVTKPMLHSTPIPLELDSDSDFNPGKVKEQSTPLTRKRSSKRKRLAEPSDREDDAPAQSKPRKRRSEVLSSISRESEIKTQQTANKGKAGITSGIRTNLLLQFFGDLGLQSASEGIVSGDNGLDDPDDDDHSSLPSGGESDSDVSSRSDGDNLKPALPRTLAIVAEEMRLKTQSRNASQATSVNISSQDSATESESEPEPTAFIPLKQSHLDAEINRPLPFLIPGECNSSATESESDLEPATTDVKATQSPDTGGRSTSGHKIEKHLADETDSETEPESELDGSDSRSSKDSQELAGESDDHEQEIHTRPSFPLTPAQETLGPLVLDPSYQHVPCASRARTAPPKPRLVQVPPSINTHLRDYQRDGVRFFWERYRESRGGLLGDDMGLGKTIQIIAFLAALMSKSGTSQDINRRREHVSHLMDSPLWKKKRTLPEGPDEKWPTALIVAPSSVVGNWERELETWGYFEVGTYSTAISSQERDAVLKDFKLGRLDVLLTTFDLARRDIDLLDDLPFSCIFVDEAHRVKNPRSKLTEAFHRFKCVRRFGVTGTAIQNSYKELWTILDWTNPGAVGTKKQWELYVGHPLTHGQSKSASEEERMKAATVARILKEKFLPVFFLRRTKDLIKDQLPKKTDEVVFCPLGPKQIDVYRRIVASEPVQNMVRKDEVCDCKSGKRRRSCCYPYDKADLFKYMSALIKISNHLALILPSPTDTPEQVARNKALSELAFPDGDIPNYGPAMLIPRYCGKWMVLETLLNEWQKVSSNKVLIFTKSVKLLEMLEFHLQSQNLGFVKLDGSTKQSDRMPIIDRFNHDPSVFIFLISTLAGGTGLNLTGANKVVIFDPNWNPAHDLQAMDRAYRFGQTRDVSVYRLLGAGSLEELIYARQVYKQQQMAVGYDASIQTRYFDGVQGDKRRQGELFGLRNIFSLKEGEIGTKMAIEKATLMDLDWALANMEAKSKAPRMAGKAGWVYEAEASGKKEDGELRGLGALLFDDDTPESKLQEDDISTTLKDIGVDYTHRNESLITENVVESERMKALFARKALKQASSSRKATKTANASAKPKSSDSNWPPKRGHHKRPQTPQEKLIARREALVKLGMIANPSEVNQFAQNFIGMTKGEQQEILDKLDHQARRSSSQL